MIETFTQTSGSAMRSNARRKQTGRAKFIFGATLIGLIFALAASLCSGIMIGAVNIDLREILGIIAYKSFAWGEIFWSPAHEQIVWGLRLPRVLLGAAVGAGLAMVGATLQALVRNPLADPYVFGITSGASVGATLVLFFGLAAFGSYFLSAAAFGGGIVALLFVLLLARSAGGVSPFRLILSGLAISYTMSALTSFLIFRAAAAGDAGIAESVLFWLLGGLAGARWGHVWLPLVGIAAGFVYLFIKSPQLNILLLGDETATTLGINLTRLRTELFILAALLTGLMVAVSGGIGFVGLMIPHAVRFVTGSNHRRLYPLAALAGAVFLIWADVLARVIVAPQELPIGILTALVGTPFFVVLMHSSGRILRGEGGVVQ